MLASLSSAPTTQLVTATRYQCADGSLVGSASQCAAYSSGSDDSLSGGAVAGIVIGCIAFVAFVVAAAVLLLANRRKVTPKSQEAHITSPGATEQPTTVNTGPTVSVATTSAV